MLFHVVTLPVEFDASSRALSQLDNSVSRRPPVRWAPAVLNAAAMTYVAGALVAVCQLLYYVFIFMGQRD